MSIESPLSEIYSEQQMVLTKAVGKAATYWEISNKQLAEIIGLSEASVSRLKQGQYILDCKAEAGQLSSLFLRVFRGLDAYMGGNIENERRWLFAQNHALKGRPIEIMKDVEGLINVVQYVERMRIN